MASSQVVLAAVAAVLISLLMFVLAPLFFRFYRASLSPLHDLRGPPSLSWKSGSIRDAFEPDAPEFFERSIREYGPTFKYHSFMNMQKLFTLDLKAVNYILSHSMVFYKTEEVRYLLEGVLGKGLFAVEGQHHKQQRRILNPAFGLPQIRALTSIFVNTSIELRDVLMAEIAASPVREDKYYLIDIYAWLSKAALDMIGMAGFDYAFNALTPPDDRPNELSKALHNMVGIELFTLSFLVPLVFPPARYIPTERSRKTAKSLATVRRVSSQIVAEKKAAVLASLGAQERLEKQDFASRDIMSLLIKANLAADLPESARLNDDDLISQIPTMIVAGHDTNSVLLAWTLFHLCINTKVQDKLRAEVTALHTDAPTMDELNTLSYLDAVLREALRVDGPVSSTERVAIEDCVIPVENEYVDKHGKVRREIRLNKGDAISIPVREINKSKELWGEDAMEFIPERWERPPEATKNIPSIGGNLLSFLSGPHGCIGYRFAIVEAKAVLFTLIRSFTFALALPKEEIVRKTMAVGRPHVVREMSRGPQMPLLIRPLSAG